MLSIWYIYNTINLHFIVSQLSTVISNIKVIHFLKLKLKKLLFIFWDFILDYKRNKKYKMYAIFSMNE